MIDRSELVARLREAPDPYGSYLYDIAAAQIEADGREIERLRGEAKARPLSAAEYGYVRVMEAFDRNETAGSFLREDGDGGFSSGVIRMAEEIDRLRAQVDELDFLRHEGGPQSVAAMEEALRLIVISPELYHLSPEQQHERCVNIAGAVVGEQP